MIDFFRLILIGSLSSVSVEPTKPPEPVEIQALREAVEELDAWNSQGARERLKPLEARWRSGASLKKYELWILANFFFTIFENKDAQTIATTLLQSDVTSYREDRFLEMIVYSTDRLASFTQARRGRWIVWYEHPLDQLLIDGLVEALEKTHEFTVKEWGYQNSEPVPIVIAPDFETFIKMSTLRAFEVDTSGTIALCKFERLFLTSPRVTRKGYAWMDTVAHEYLHYVINKISRGRIPIWLHEGIARHDEGRWRGEDGSRLRPWEAALLDRRRKKNQLIPFSAMSPSIAKLPSAEDAALAFIQVQLAVDHLYRTCPSCVPRLIRGAQHRKFPQLFQEIVKSTITEFERSLIDVIKEKPLTVLPGLAIEMPEKTGRKEPAQRERDHTLEIAERIRAEGLSLGAARSYERAIESSARPFDSAWRTKAANAYRESGEVAEAERIYRSMLTANPDDGTAWFGLAELFEAAGNRTKALEAIAEVKRVSPFFEPAYRLKLRIHTALKADEEIQKVRGALDLFEKYRE